MSVAAVRPPRQKLSSSERLLAAALEMFSRHGAAATTREIADAAGVNEVTLFRLFESKDQLLAAVVREVVRAQAEALDAVDLENLDLRRDLTAIADVYSATYQRYEPFIRTMMSQPVQPRLNEQIMRDVVQPLRARFIAYLAEAQRRGVIRQGPDLSATVDAFTGMIFAAVLRRAVYAANYSHQTYLANCIELFLNGIGER
jgi:AcrR family transcriptional regulator